MSRAVAKKGAVSSVAAVSDAAPSLPIASMIERIMTDPSIPMERVDQAFEFYQKVQAESAKKAFLEAKAAFKASAPLITKDKENKQYKSTYASIGNVVNTLNEALSPHGLDASWSFDQTDANIKVTCTLRHVAGHSESVSLSGPPDVSGSKNPMQQIKSTLTYLKLATFEGVTGIATREGNLDDDGNAAGGKTDAPITAEQIDELIALADEVGADKAKFCKFYQIGSFAEIMQSQFAKAKGVLEAKRKAAAQ